MRCFVVFTSGVLNCPFHALVRLCPMCSIFSVLMGDNVMPRKEYINDHASILQLDDLDF